MIYNYEIIFKPEQAESLLYAFKQLLTRGCAKKLPSVKKWKFEEFITIHGKHIKLGIKGIMGSHTNCISLAFPKDESFDAQAIAEGYRKEYGIGCIGAYITVGTKWGLLELISPGSDISMLLEKEAFKKHITDKLQSVSEAIILNMDTKGSMLLYPVTLPWKSFRYDDQYLIETFDAEGDMEFYYEFDVEIYIEKVMQEVDRLMNKNSLNTKPNW